MKENTFNAPFFELLMKILCSNNQREAVKVIKALSEQGSNLFGKYKSQITNPEALQYLEQ